MTSAPLSDLHLLDKPVAASEIIPQSSPMRLIDTLVACHDAMGRVVARVPHDGLFVRPDGLLSSAGLTELIAQTAAAQQAYEAILAGNPPKQGFLVGIKDLRISGACAAGDTAEITCRRTFTMGEASLIEGTVRLGGRVLAEGVIKVWEQNEFPSRPDASPAAESSGSARQADDTPESPIRRALLARMRDIEVPSADAGLTAPELPAIATAALQLDADFPAFEGHFPDYPILPAVVMLEIGLLLTERAAGHPLDLLGIPHAKFSRTSYPDDMLVVTLATASPLADGEPGEALVRITRDGKRIASLTILVAKSPTCE